MLDESQYCFVEVEDQKEKEVNVVLSGGGGISLACLTTLDLLSKKHIKPKTIMGTSTGAIFGFLMAAQLPVKILKSMIFEQPDCPILPYSSIFDFQTGKQRKKEYNENIKKIIAASRGSSHVTNAIHMSVWSLLTMLRTLDKLSQDADTLTETMINGRICKGERLVEQTADILEYLGKKRMMSFAQFQQCFDVDFQVLITDLTAKQPLLLNSRTTPKLPIAIGVAMSASFPFMYPPIPWKKEWGLYNGKEDLCGNLMIDGSLVGNLPLRYFISNEPYIIELRGGKLLDINKTLFLNIDETKAPPMTIEQEKAVASIPEATPPKCHTHFLSFGNWANVQLISTILQNVKQALHGLVEITGFCEEIPPTGPSSWDQVVDSFEELCGPKVLISIALTLYKFEDKLLQDYYNEEVIKIPGKGLETFSEGLSQENTAPFVKYCYAKVSERLNELFSLDPDVD